MIPPRQNPTISSLHVQKQCVLCLVTQLTFTCFLVCPFCQEKASQAPSPLRHKLMSSTLRHKLISSSRPRIAQSLRHKLHHIQTTSSSRPRHHHCDVTNGMIVTPLCRRNVTNGLIVTLLRHHYVTNGTIVTPLTVVVTSETASRLYFAGRNVSGSFSL